MSQPLAFIIEDDEVIAKIFSTAVREAKFETIIIRDGIEAKEKLESIVPDLVVLDLHLPGISGINILRSIRDDPRFEKTRVLIASADATQSEFLRVHADQVLIKPIGFYKMREVASQFRPN
jgi:two-component system, OmpR family, response regulator AdeR